MHFANKRVCFERDVDMTDGIDDILQSMYIIIDEMKVRFDPKKAQLVKKKHNVNMESVKHEILAGNFDIDEVKNQDGHPGQRMFLVLINGYVHCAPYVIEADGTYFLKTAFKSRIFQRRFENGELKI